MEWCRELKSHLGKFMDPIADMLIRIKNVQAVKGETVSVSYSSIKMAIAEKLLQAGFLKGVDKKGKKNKKMMDLTLLYSDKGIPAITAISRVSKLSKRIYISAKDIKSTRAGLGVQIISTTKGILTDKEARKEKVGGEIICVVW
ncbi:MAG: small subunit ribosomal protein S8 [Parcubacteria group bacterium Athens0714_24]|nr:MAG: small subunit ribosomal protein S8 [Parcubacteria group bacterium Athens0714_24]